MTRPSPASTRRSRAPSNSAPSPSCGAVFTLGLPPPRYNAPIRPVTRQEVAAISGLSSEFRKAIAAAAMSRLMEGPHSPEAAATIVAKRIGARAFPGQLNHQAVEALTVFFGEVTETSPASKPKTELEIARYHYDGCIQWVDSHDLGPDRAAEVLMQALEDSAD